MATGFDSDNIATQKPARVDVQSSHWAENVRKANYGGQVDATFRTRLEALVRQNFESGGLRQLPPEAVRSLISDGGNVGPAAEQRPDVFRDLVSLGRLNEATLLNVFHITGDSFMMKSALNVYRNGPKDEEIEPVNGISDEVSEQS